VYKTKPINGVYVLQTIFRGERCLEAFEVWRDTGIKTYDDKIMFYANPLFQFYESYALIDFGQSVYL